jgi:DNA-directed RNA polymerases I, II, and III subunit RPABC2
MSEDTTSILSIDTNSDMIHSDIINVANTYSKYFADTRESRPYITKFERAKIIGVRAEQLAVGADANVHVPDYITDVRKIAEMEFHEKKIPFIIRRRLPDNTFEYFRLSDFKNI